MKNPGGLWRPHFWRGAPADLYRPGHAEARRCNDFDEPTTGLDPENVRLIQEFIFRQKHITRIVITHDWSKEYLDRFDEVIQVPGGTDCATNEKRRSCDKKKFSCLIHVQLKPENGARGFPRALNNEEM